MPRSAEEIAAREKRLQALVEMLREHSLAAPDIARKEKVTKATAYRWLELLRGRRKVRRILEQIPPGGKPGPRRRWVYTAV